ncbi:hypothetical protein Dimus_027446, partial [Dionaea muscipula]
TVHLLPGACSAGQGINGACHSGAPAAFITDANEHARLRHRRSRPVFTARLLCQLHARQLPIWGTPGNCPHRARRYHAAIGHAVLAR